MDLALALRAFVRTVERGSLTAAARDLGVSQPAVTKHLRNLEQHLGARLLERSARSVRPTTQGQNLYETCRSALASIDSALGGVRREMGAIEGPLRIHAPACIGMKHIYPMVVAFQSKYPAVNADLVLENRSVDLAYENFDLGIKYGRPEGQELIIRRLGLIRRILVASPKFLTRVGRIDSLEKLKNVRVVTSHTVLAPHERLTLHRQGQAFHVAVSPVLRTNNAEIITRTLLGGHAAGPVQVLLVTKELAAGELIRILPEYEIKPTEAFLAYPSIRFMRPVVRAFADLAISTLRGIDGIDASDTESSHRDVEPMALNTQDIQAAE